MKRDRLFSLLWAVALSLCIALSGICCLITGFSLSADMMGIVLFCIAFAIVSALVNMTRWGNWILAGLLLLLGCILWLGGELEHAVEALLYQISTVYDMAYGWGTVYWSAAAPVWMDVDLALIAIATAVIWAVTWTVMHRQHSILAIDLGILPLCPCLVVTDRLPAMDCLFWLITGILILILTQTVRRQKEKDGNRLTAILLIPAILCANLLFYAVPQSDYMPPVSVPGWIEELLSNINLVKTDVLPGAPSDSVELMKIGPKSQNRNVVMEITAEQGGILYLRRQSFDTYDGLSWSISEDAYEDPYWPTGGLKDGGSVRIYLRAGLELAYLPYFTKDLQQMQFGRLENDFGRSYTVRRLVPDGTAKLKTMVKRDALVRQCLWLPNSTMQKAEQILKTLGSISHLSDAQKAQLIGDYVQSIATYDRNTAKMPDGVTDFAIWFLEEADTGYCVHFATAATVLLRAAGVPARYAVGYLTEAQSGVKTNVLAEQSHAWVEYLDSKSGWTVLDPTPAEPEPQPTETTPPTEQTEPSESIEPTQELTSEPTEPSQGEDPTNAATTDTKPTATTAPFGSDATPEKKDLTVLWNCLMAVAYAAIAVALIWGQYALRISLRRRKLHSGGNNRRALCYWKEIVRLSKLYRQPLSEDLELLAQKAKFSQHTLTNAELKLLKDRVRELNGLLMQKPWYQRLGYKLLFAVE